MCEELLELEGQACIKDWELTLEDADAPEAGLQ
jgi:hypothetical protein